MRSSCLKCVLSLLLAWLLPAQMFAADTASAIVYSNGTTWLNGSAVPSSAVLFDGDLIQTRADSQARINATGSSVMVLPDSLVKFQGARLELEHGAVRVATSQNLVAKVEDVTIKPAANTWTEFQIADVNGDVQIAATKGDVAVQDDQGNTTTVPQGQQTTVSNHKKKHRKGEGAPAAARGGLMSSRDAIIGGVIIIGGVTAWALLQDGTPMSPSCRNQMCPP